MVGVLDGHLTAMSWKSEQSQRWDKEEEVLFQYSRKVTAHRDMKTLRKTVPALSNSSPTCRNTNTGLTENLQVS